MKTRRLCSDRCLAAGLPRGTREQSANQSIDIGMEHEPEVRRRHLHVARCLRFATGAPIDDPVILGVNRVATDLRAAGPAQPGRERTATGAREATVMAILPVPRRQQLRGSQDGGVRLEMILKGRAEHDQRVDELRAFVRHATGLQAPQAVPDDMRSLAADRRDSLERALQAFRSSVGTADVHTNPRPLRGVADTLEPVEQFSEVRVGAENARNDMRSPTPPSTLLPTRPATSPARP